MNLIGRRRLLRAGAGAALALPLASLLSRRARAETLGPLVSDPDGVLDLPEGFSYTIVETAGGDMDDGYRVPARPDGMECFAGPSGTIILMRNHELTPGSNGGPYKPGQQPAAEAFDAASQGGVTRLVLDDSSFERISSNLVLVGTNRNCAGGRSPWGWLSCEENVSQGHGYVFVCPTDAASVQSPQRVVGYGRCNHEAATVDPATNIAYLTEDKSNSCFYRFVPSDPNKPFEGKLQALKLQGQDKIDTGGWGDIHQPQDVEWIDIDEPDPTSDSLRYEAQGKGAAIFSRGEGIVFDESGSAAIYFCCTNGGPIGGGQIFRLDIESDVLSLVGVSTSGEQLQMPDNIGLAPWGDIVMAEDGFGDNYLRGLAADGSVYDIARNAKSTSELAGVCFSPDGKAMFVNMQNDGLTIVITGPFPSRPSTSSASGSNTTGGATVATGAGGAGAGSGSGSGAAGGSRADDDGQDADCSCATVGDKRPSIAATLLSAAAVAAGVSRRSAKPSSPDSST
jgi:secreted PhoX family phosphatase